MSKTTQPKNKKYTHLAISKNRRLLLDLDKELFKITDL